jgi:hypothetical protein
MAVGGNQLREAPVLEWTIPSGSLAAGQANGDLTVVSVEKAPKKR